MHHSSSSSKREEGEDTQYAFIPPAMRRVIRSSRDKYHAHTTSSSGSPQKNMEMIFLLLLQLFVGGTAMWKNKKASHRGNPLRAETIRLNTVLYVDSGFSARCVVNSWWWLTRTLAVRVNQVTTKRQISQVWIEYWNYFSLSNLVAIQLQVPTTSSFTCFD